MTRKPRPPQLALRLDAAAAPDPLAGWCDGRRLPYLGGALTLRLATGRESVERSGDVLHLTLPPEASPRQIRDACEAWLRGEARRCIAAALDRTGGAHAEPPRWRISFAGHGAWAETDADGRLRFHWRLVEQPPTVLEQVVARALAAIPPTVGSGDLFAVAAGSGA